MPTELKGCRTLARVDERLVFEEKVTSFLDQLYGAALRLAKNREDAEDLVAEAVAKGWSSRRSLKDPDKFRSWIFPILTNTFISGRRKREVRPQGETFAEHPSVAETTFLPFEELHQPFLLWWGNPEKDFLNKLLSQDIEKAVDALPQAFRMVIVLSDMEGFSYQEISEVLRIPVGTVRSRLARGRGLLQKALGDHAKDAGLITSR